MDMLLNNSFLIGSGLTVIVFLFNVLTEKSPLNTVKNRMTCILYVISFASIGYGTSDFFGPPERWWHTAIMILAGILAFGAALEAKKKLPLAPREMQKATEDD